MDKPLTIVAYDFENTLIDTVNNAGLPAFIIKPILERVLQYVKQAEQRQLKSDMEAYKQSIENNEGENDD